MHFYITFDPQHFNKSGKKNSLCSDIMSLKLNSSDFVNYLKQTPYIILENKKQRTVFNLTHIEVTIEGRVLCYCFINKNEQTLRIVDNEP